MSDFESAQPQVAGGFAPPAAVADFGPDLPPLWAAVNVGRAKKVWTGVPGQYYWHARHGFVAVGHKQGKRVDFKRACGECGKQTLGLKEPLCGKCGGKREVVPPCANDGCDRVSHHAGANGRVCSVCWVKEDVAKNGCPGCRKWSKSTRADELCGNCVRDAKVQAKRDAQQPALDAFRALDTRLQLLAKGKKGVPGTYYAGLNQQGDYKPFAFSFSPGKDQFACCTAPEGGALCLQAAVWNETFGNTRCVKDGGGLRCIGGYKDGIKDEEHWFECVDGVAIQRGKGDKYAGRCVKCFISSEPNDPRAELARRYLNARELTVRKVLAAAFPDYTWTFDRRFATGKLTYRPDARVFLADRTIIVEIDEDSHRTYDCGTERARELAFFERAGSRVVVVLRFNPDSYTDVNGVKHAGCFKYCQPPENYASIPKARWSPQWGTTSVDPKQKAQWQARCDELIATIENFMDPDTAIPPPELDRVVFSSELFYDNIAGMAPEAKAKAMERRKRLGPLRKQQREAAEAEVARKRKREVEAEAEA